MPRYQLETLLQTDAQRVRYTVRLPSPRLIQKLVLAVAYMAGSVTSGIDSYCLVSCSTLDARVHGVADDGVLLALLASDAGRHRAGSWHQRIIGIQISSPPNPVRPLNSSP
jgi:hypothetical protein